MATSSRNPNTALEVIQYLTSASAERCLLAVGGFPATRASAYSSSSLPSATLSDDQPDAYCGTVSSPGFTVELSNAIRDALQEAVPRPSTSLLHRVQYDRSGAGLQLPDPRDRQNESKRRCRGQLTRDRPGRRRVRAQPAADHDRCLLIVTVDCEPALFLGLSGFEPLPANVA